MIWWPFNEANLRELEILKVVTHQWSGDPSIKSMKRLLQIKRRNSPMIWWPFNVTKAAEEAETKSRNSPMIWWPFNK